MRSESPFFSVIVPVYNAEKFLKECLDSILAQTFGDFEAILVDDGSTDFSGQICEYYARTDSRIHVLHKENEGQMVARNEGCSKALGRYIVSCDSDDMLRVDALEIIKKTIDFFDADMVLFDASREKDFVASWRQLQLPTNKILQQNDLFTLICQGDSLNNFVLKAFRAEYADNLTALLQYSHVRNGEDLLQSIAVITKAVRPVYIQENLYYYRVNLSSLSNVFQKTLYQSIATVGTIIMEYAKQWENSEYWVSMVQDRNLRGCAGAIWYIFFNCMDRKTGMQLLREIEESAFFIDSYENGNICRLSAQDRRIVCALREKKWHFLRLVYWSRSVFTKCKGFIKKAWR